MIDKLKSKTLYNKLKDEQIVVNLFKSDVATYDIMIEREYHKNGDKIKRFNYTFSGSILERAEEKFLKIIDDYLIKNYEEVVMWFFKSY